jgi:hypothetical protein
MKRFGAEWLDGMSKPPEYIRGDDLLPLIPPGECGKYAIVERTESSQMVLPVQRVVSFLWRQGRGVEELLKESRP